MEDLPENAVLPLTRAAWRAYLDVHHQLEQGVWLVRYKKHSGKPYLSEDDAICEALCFGWIDSKPRKLDEERTMLWFSPRQTGSGWSKVNKDRINKLLAKGLMTPAGLAKIEAAKADWSWAKLDAISALEQPPELRAELAKYPDARDNFTSFPSSVQRGILEWIINAKRPDTRTKRIAETARLAQENERANQWRKR